METVTDAFMKTAEAEVRVIRLPQKNIRRVGGRTNGGRRADIPTTTPRLLTTWGESRLRRTTMQSLPTPHPPLQW
jgi:hypothetical protein